MNPINDSEVVGFEPSELPLDSIASGAEEELVFHSLPDFEMKSSDPVDSNFENRGLVGQLFLFHS